MSYAQVKYSDEDSNYVSNSITCCSLMRLAYPLYNTRLATLVLQDIFKYSSSMILQENMFHMWCVSVPVEYFCLFFLNRLIGWHLHLWLAPLLVYRSLSGIGVILIMKQ